jgi:AAHS family 3-hydroxyphenylpropionic acid transporter
MRPKSGGKPNKKTRQATLGENGMLASVETTRRRAGSIGIVAICLAAATIEGFDIQAAGVVAPKLAPILRLTPHQMGLFFASATFGMIAGAVLGGGVADHFGRRSGLVLSLAAFGVFTYATAYAHDFEILFITRFFTGLGLGGALPNLVAIAAEAVEPRRRGLAVGVVYSGLPLGGALASAAAMGLENWQSLFFLGAVLPLVLIPLVIWFLPSSPPSRDAHGKSNDVKAGRGILNQENRAATLLLWLAFFLSVLVLYLLLNWQPVLLVSKGFTASSASAVQATFNLSGGAASILAGLVSDTRQRRLAVVVSTVLLLCTLLYFAVLPPYLPLAVLAGAALGAGVVSSQSILYGLAPQVYQAHVRGRGVGFAVGMGRFGSVVGPLLAGVLIANGNTVTEVLMGIMPIAFAGGLATFFLVTVLERRRPMLNTNGTGAESQAKDKTRPSDTAATVNAAGKA